MKKIHLHGYLAERFGACFIFDVPTPAMAISALRYQLAGFDDAIRDGKFILIRGPKETGISIDETELALKFGNTREFHLIPALDGAGGRGGSVIKVVLGIALMAIGIAGAVFTGGASAGAGFAAAAVTLGKLGSISFGTIASFGLAITLTGASTLLASRPNFSGSSYEDREAPDQRPSFLYNGAVNVSQEGLPVPLVYGRMRVGSVVVSTGLSAEQI